MKFLRLLSLLLFVATSFNAKAQYESPTLQAGLNGISFSKGNLDAALIAEIIAEKQQELKTRLIKTMLLNSLGIDNGLFYSYIDNTIDIIANEKNESTRVRNLLENTVNLAFVITYAEYYLYTLQENSPQLRHMRKLAFAYGLDSGVIQPRMSLRDITRLKYSSQTSFGRERLTSDEDEEADRNKFVGLLLDIVAEAVKNDNKLKAIGLLRTSYLQNQSASNAYYMLSKSGDEEFENFKDNASRSFKRNYNELSDLFEKEEYQKFRKKTLSQLTQKQYSVLDSNDTEISDNFKKAKETFEQMFIHLNKKAKTNESYKEVLNAYNYNQNYPFLGFVKNGLDSLFLEVYGIQPSIINKAVANNTKLKQEWTSFYNLLDLQYKFNLFTEIFDKKQAAETIVNDIGNQLDVLLKYYGLIKTLASKGNDINTVWEVLDSNFKCGTDSTNLFNAIVSTFDSSRNDISNVAALTGEDLKAFNKVNSFIGKLRLVEANRYEYLAQYESDIEPALNRLSKYSQNYSVLKSLMFQRLICYASQAKTELDALGLNIGNSFINLLVSIDEFDEAATFQKYLNQLADAGDIFSNEKLRSSINRVTTFVRSYIKVTENDSNQFIVNIDAQGFITSLQSLNYNKFSPWNLHFTVGSNMAAFNRPLTLESGTTINNYSFIGEKIGLQYKLWDNKYLKSFSRGETFTYWRKGIPFLGKTTYVRNAPPSEPIISNVHILAYGSGILYNLVNTGTTQDFNSPLVGTGLGITFYNGLDVNASIGTPILSNTPFLDKSVPFFFNLGMDIQFVEYINRLNQRRRERQTQKKLAEAAAKD